MSLISRITSQESLSVPQQIALVTVVMGLAALASYLCNQWFLSNIATLLILQLGVVTAALLTEKVASVLSGFIGALAYNYLFTNPYFSLHMTEYEDFINMLVFLIIAFITSHLADYYKQQREQLKQAELRARILLSVSHDLRTPLSSVIGILETIKEYQLDKSQKDELISNALDESHRLHRYIENLLQATKIQHGQLNLLLLPADMPELLNNVLTRFQSSRLIANFHADLPAIAVQAHLLEQAIYNLIDNALRYSPENLPVEIVVLQHSKQLQIRVIDQGPGISHCAQEKIFEVFYSSRIGDRGEGGTGLGLHVAAGIVQAHQGTLVVLPTAKGCTMQINLPISLQAT